MKIRTLNNCPICGSPMLKEAIASMDLNIENELKKALIELEFHRKNSKEKIRILLSKFWLTHSNDQVFEQFGCNFVPNDQYQEKARSIVNISTLEFDPDVLNNINTRTIKSVMYGCLNYPI